MAEVINGILIREVETKNIMTKSSLPVGGYSVNPYVGCTHACKYCYASFMKRFTGHTEEWGTFLDVKHWPEIKNPKKYAGQRVVIGSVTDGYNPQEEQFRNTRKLLEQLIGSDADILICTKSDLVVRDIDLLKKLGRVTVSWSINALDENFKNDMDSAPSIERRIAAMKQVYDAGIRTVCFVSPVFPGITDFEAIFERVKNQCDLFWLENLNLRGGFKKTIMDYISGKYPDLVPLYDEIAGSQPAAVRSGGQRLLPLRAGGLLTLRQRRHEQALRSPYAGGIPELDAHRRAESVTRPPHTNGGSTDTWHTLNLTAYASSIHPQHARWTT